MGGGMEGPPVRGPAGPRFPLLPAAAPPRQGRGLRPVRRWSKGVEGAGIMYGLFLRWGAVAAESRSAGLSWRAARGYAGAQRGTALGRNTGPRRRVRCCVGARRGSAMQRSMRLRRGRSVGSRRAQPAAVLESPVGRC